ncbi:MAG TPA: hypothetical protein VFW25_09065 [Silvibacterium sp.]|nr:hypothetical protein [Silvibacterium sp.]
MQTRPPLDFTSVYAKLDRAEEHLNAVYAEIAQWHNSCRYESFPERGSQMTRVGVALLRIGPDPYTTRWAVMIGDCLSNIRAALDHIIYSFAKFHAANNPSPDIENLAFVIADSPEEFKKAARGRLKGFTQGFIDLVESFQPYRRKHPVLPPLLALIRDLSNADKHRLLQVAGAGVAQLNVTYVGTHGIGAKIGMINPEPIEKNTIVCVVESTEPDPNLAVHAVDISVQVALWHGQREGSTNPLEGRTEVVALLKLLIGEVKAFIDAVKGNL